MQTGKERMGREIEVRGIRAVVLDGDIGSTDLSRGLDFSGGSLPVRDGVPMMSCGPCAGLAAFDRGGPLRRTGAAVTPVCETYDERTTS